MPQQKPNIQKFNLDIAQLKNEATTTKYPPELHCLASPNAKEKEQLYQKLVSIKCTFLPYTKLYDSALKMAKISSLALMI